jgi:small-conductance mechanosensitive channel
VGVAYKEDIRRVLDILRDIAANLPEALTEPAPLVQAAAFGDSSVNIDFGVWTATSNAVNMKTEMILAVKSVLTKRGLKYPTRISPFIRRGADVVSLENLIIG